MPKAAKKAASSGNANAESGVLSGRREHVGDKPGRKVESRGAQAGNVRADGGHQAGGLREQEDPEGADDPQPFATGDPGRASLVEDDLLGAELEREGDRFGFAGSQPRRHQPVRNRLAQPPLDQPIRFGDARRLGGDRGRDDDGAEQAGQEVEATDLVERDQRACVADGGVAAAISRTALFSASHSSSV